MTVNRNPTRKVTVRTSHRTVSPKGSAHNPRRGRRTGFLKDAAVRSAVRFFVQATSRPDVDAIMRDLAKL